MVSSSQTPHIKLVTQRSFSNLDIEEKGSEIRKLLVNIPRVRLYNSLFTIDHRGKLRKGINGNALNRTAVLFNTKCVGEEKRKRMLISSGVTHHPLIYSYPIIAQLVFKDHWRMWPFVSLFHCTSKCTWQFNEKNVWIYS